MKGLTLLAATGFILALTLVFALRARVIAGKDKTESVPAAPLAILKVPIPVSDGVHSPFPSPERKTELRSQFSQLAQENVAVRTQYELLKQKLPVQPESELIAMYAAQVLGRSSRPEFQELYLGLMGEVAFESPRVFDVLIASADKLRQDPFEHQVLLNLAAELNVPPREKVRLMGPTLVQKFEISAQNEVSEQSASLVIALIQLRKAGVAYQDIAPFVQRGMEFTSNDRRANDEFRVRVTTYYPDAEF
ncbi:MAG: hypothetical protein IPJ84_06550 [Bdellovibrionales bacterium]|nr:hypothetical protein [Bdellovibrionales bacterium]